MKPVSLADITYEQGLKLITMRKQALDSGQIRRMPPAAMQNSHFLQKVGEDVLEKAGEGIWDNIKNTATQVGNTAKSSFGDFSKYMKDNPEFRNTLYATGAGVGLGALGGVTSGKRKHWLRNMLMGGVAGGALGGGIGLATNPDVLSKATRGLSKRLGFNDPGGSSGGTKSPFSSNKYQQEAQRIFDEQDSGALAKHESKAIPGWMGGQGVSSTEALTGDLESSVPHLITAAGAAGLTAAEISLLKRTAKVQHWDERSFAKALRNMVKSKVGENAIDAPKLNSFLNPDGGSPKTTSPPSRGGTASEMMDDFMDDPSGRRPAPAPAPTVAGAGSHLKQIDPSALQHMSDDEIVKLLRERKLGSGRWMGGKTDIMEKQLRALGASNADELTEASLKNLRPHQMFGRGKIRGGLGGAAVGGGLLGGGFLINKLMKDLNQQGEHSNYIKAYRDLVEQQSRGG